MAKGYNLTVQLNLQGPNNLNGVVNNINKRLNNIQANVNVKLPTSTLRQIAQVNRNLKQTGKSAADAASGMEKFGKAAGLAVKRFGAFTAATAGFYAITRATQQSLEKFVEFDRQLTRIAQVTNSSKQSLNGLTNEITKLSVSLGASSTELASVAVTLSQAGLSARETQRALKALALTTLAPTFSNLNQTVEGSIALMKQFSISTRQLEQALGSINAVAGSFAVEAGDLITAVQRAGGVFASASKGVATGTDALNQFLAVFTSVRATTRESAETIATGLRTIFTRIQRSDTIESLRAFGVTLTDLEGKFVGPYRAIEQLSKGLRSLDPRSLEFSSIVEELGGFRQVGKVIPLIQRFSTAQQALNVAQQGSGSLARDAATGQQALGVQISKVQQQFDALIRSIGQTGEFRQFITLSLDLASALIKIADAIKPVLPALAALGAAKVIGGLGGLAKGFKGGIGFNQGGMVPGSGNFDSVKANLTPGEFVIRKKAVQAIGADNLHRMNKYAEGGVVNYPSSRRFVKNRKSTYNKEPGVSIQSALGASLPLVLNPKDKVQASIFRQSFSGQDLANKNSKLSSAKAYLNAPSPQARGIAFENLLLQTKQIKRKAGGSSRIDAESRTGNFVEIKSVKEPVTDADLMKKVVGSIFRPRSNIDDLAMQRASGTSLTNRADVMSIGSLLVFEDSSALSAAGKKRSQVGNTKVSKQLKKAATGGPISGQDTVPALLTPGEFVISKGAASRIGSSNLKALNNADRITGYNRGGFVQRFNKGGSPKGGVGSGGVLDLFLIQGSVSALTAAMGDATRGTKLAGDVAQSFATALNTGIVAFSALQMVKGGSTERGRKSAGRGAAALGVIFALDGVLKSVNNSAKEFDKQLGQTNFDKALDEASKSLETLAKNGNDAAAAAQLQSQISQSVSSARAINEASTGGRYSLRQGVMDLAAYFTGTGGVTGIASGMGDQYDLAASRVRSRQGITGGFSEFMDPEGFAKQVRAEITATEDASAKRFGATRDIVMQRGLQQIDRGASIRDVFKGLSKDAREAIARSDAGVAKRLDAAGGAGTAAGQDIINQEVTKQLQITLGPALADRIARTSETAAAQLQVALKRVFDDISSGFKSVTARVDANFARAADSLSASLGKVGIRISGARGKNILENNSAFSPELIKRTIGAVTTGAGRSGDRVSQFALASTQIGDNIATIIDNKLREGGDPNKQLGGIRGGLLKMLSGMNLGKDVEQVISKQLNDAFAQATKELGDAADPTELRQKVNEIVEKLPAFTGALDLVKQQFEGVLNAQTRYAAAIDQISQAIIQQREYFNRASSIRREGDLALRKGLGENIPIGDIIGNVAATVANQTGGITNIDALSQRLGQLQSRRDQVQGRLDAISGLTKFADEQQKLTLEMGNLNLEISSTRQGLETLANSTEVASAALSRIQELRQRADQQLGFAEKLVGSTPQELGDIQGLIATLEGVASGQELTMQNSFMAQRAYMQSALGGGNALENFQAAQGGLARQRQGAVNLLKELQPFFGDNNQQFNKMYETVMRSFLKSQGLMQGELGKALEKAFAARANRGNEQQQLIRTYNHAIQEQAKATAALGQNIPIQQSLVAANNNLRSAIVGLTQQLARAPLQMPINRSAGGPVYASQGQLVNMQPRGTDTVPAMLTPGEFVVNAKATKKNRGLLEAINGRGSASTIGGITYANEGGEAQNRHRFALSRSSIPAEQRYAMLLAEYKQRYGMGVQGVIPLAAIGQLKALVAQENANLARYFEWFANNQDAINAKGIATSDIFTAGDEQRNKQQKDYLTQYHDKTGREHPEVLRAKLLENFFQDTENEKHKNYRRLLKTANPAQVYMIARNAGAKDALLAPGGVDAYLARKKKRDEQIAERKRRAAEIQAQEAEDVRNATNQRRSPRGRPQTRAPLPGFIKEGLAKQEKERQARDREKEREISPGEQLQRDIETKPAGPATRKGPTEEQKEKQQREKMLATISAGDPRLREKAAVLINSHEKSIKDLEAAYQESISGTLGIGGTMLAWGDYLFRGGQSKAYYDNQIQGFRNQIGSAKHGLKLLDMASDKALDLKTRLGHFKGAQGLLGGRTITGSRTAATNQELEAYANEQMANAVMTGGVAADVATLGAGALGRKAITKGGSFVYKGVGLKTATKEATKEVAKRKAKVEAIRATTKLTGAEKKAAAKKLAERTALQEAQEKSIAEASEQARREVASNRAVYDVSKGIFRAPKITQSTSPGVQDALAKGYTVGLRSVQKFSKGGPVGTDTVPAMLTPGEFVVNRDATKRNRGLLESINGSGKPMSRGGVVYAQNGGLFGIGEVGDLGGGGGGGGGGVDFAGFIAAANTLTPNLSLFATAATALSEKDFGVLNDAGTQFQGASNAFGLAARNFGAPITKFDNSIGMFVNQTNNLIAAISNMGQIEGTVNVVGTIAFAPIEVNVLGLDQIAGLIAGIENSVLAQVGAALSQDNPGITVNTLSSGGSQIA